MKVVNMILPLSLIAVSGFAQDVRYNFDKGANFSAFKTYKWVKVKDAPAMNNLVEQQINAAIDAELAKKGLTKTEGDKADLYVAYQVTIGQEKEFSSYSSDFGYGAGWGRGCLAGGWRHGAIHGSHKLFRPGLVSLHGDRRWPGYPLVIALQF